MIRHYTIEDETACLAVLTSNTPTYFDLGDVDEYQQFLRNIIGDYFVTVIDGQVAACGGCYVGENGVGGLTWGMVRATNHRKGLGSELLSYRLEAIRSVPHVWCVVLNTTQLTAPFFERFGFRTFRMIENGYGEGLHKHSMHLVWRPCDPPVNP